MNPKHFFSVVIPVTMVVFCACQKQNGSENIVLELTNLLPDIRLSEVHTGNDTQNLLEHELEPGESVRLTILNGTSTVTAMDTEGGVYRSRIGAADTTEVLYSTISINNRSVFEETIESGGEYWAGSGPGIIVITNSLENLDVYSVGVTPLDEGSEDGSDVLGAFILFPESVLNVRAHHGLYRVTAEDNNGNNYVCEVMVEDGPGALTTCNISQSTLVPTTRVSGTGSGRLLVCNALGDWVMTGLYNKPTSGSRWSENYLGQVPLQPKGQILLLLDSGTYDIRAVDEDNDTYTIIAVPVSEEGSSLDITMDHLDQFIPLSDLSEQ